MQFNRCKNTYSLSNIFFHFGPVETLYVKVKPNDENIKPKVSGTSNRRIFSFGFTISIHSTVNKTNLMEIYYIITTTIGTFY